MNRKMIASTWIKHLFCQFTVLCVASLLVLRGVPACGQEGGADVISPAGQESLSALPVQGNEKPALQEKAEASLPDAPVPQSQQPANQKTNSQEQEPLGTAVAPAEGEVGNPGANLSGAAIAPGKQHRVRTIVISLGIAIAAAAVIGTVAGLSLASHSTP